MVFTYPTSAQSIKRQKLWRLNTRRVFYVIFALLVVKVSPFHRRVLTSGRLTAYLVMKLGRRYEFSSDEQIG